MMYLSLSLSLYIYIYISYNIISSAAVPQHHATTGFVMRPSWMALATSYSSKPPTSPSSTIILMAGSDSKRSSTSMKRTPGQRSPPMAMPTTTTTTIYTSNTDARTTQRSDRLLAPISCGASHTETLSQTDRTGHTISRAIWPDRRVLPNIFWPMAYSIHAAGVGLR